jgi:hypothetical protein
MLLSIYAEFKFKFEFNCVIFSDFFCPGVACSSFVARWQHVVVTPPEIWPGWPARIGPEKLEHSC